MSVPYYLGAQAIAERLGYKDTKVVMRLHIEQGLPMYKRAQRLKHGGFTYMWAASESMIAAWEMLQGQRSSQQFRQKRESKRLDALHALTA
jgi:hypothetical protein